MWDFEGLLLKLHDSWFEKEKSTSIEKNLWSNASHSSLVYALLSSVTIYLGSTFYLMVPFLFLQDNLIDLSYWAAISSVIITHVVISLSLSLVFIHKFNIYYSRSYLVRHLLRYVCLTPCHIPTPSRRTWSNRLMIKCSSCNYPVFLFL